MELFEEQGFEDTTAVQIAKRARVTTRTFFRYFADKLVREVVQVADVATPLQAVTQCLAGFDWERLGSRGSLRRREVMIASTPCLLERELIKQHQMADEFGSVLLQRGVDPAVAGLAAHVGVHVFRSVYRQWLEDGDDLVSAAETVMSRLATIVAADVSPKRKKGSAALRSS